MNNCKELFQVTGLLDLIKGQVPGIPEEALDKYLEECAAIYSRHFSNEELATVCAFYSTTVGQKCVKEMPALTRECVIAAMEMF